MLRKGRYGERIGRTDQNAKGTANICKLIRIIVVRFLWFLKDVHQNGNATARKRLYTDNGESSLGEGGVEDFRSLAMDRQWVGKRKELLLSGYSFTHQKDTQCVRQKS
jgi:hypothetical protein